MTGLVIAVVVALAFLLLLEVGDRLMDWLWRHQ